MTMRRHIRPGVLCAFLLGITTWSAWKPISPETQESRAARCSLRPAFVEAAFGRADQSWYVRERRCPSGQQGSHGGSTVN